MFRFLALSNRIQATVFMSALLLSVFVLPQLSLADPVAQLPENLTPNTDVTPTPGGDELCFIFQWRRGPGSFSRWRERRDYPYYNGWEVWIGNAELNQHTWERYFAYSREGWRHESGYGDYSSSIRSRSSLLIRPRPTYNGNYDPCNRARGDWRRICGSYRYDMPVSITHDGKDYQLMDRPFSAGGRCGSPQCLCIVSGRISPLVIDFRGKGLRYTAFGQHVTFDFGDGAVATSWVANPKAIQFLAYDRNENGRIDNIVELFGDQTFALEDKEFPNGFEALKTYDKNNDGRIDGKDEIFKKLLLWSDRNINGRTEEGELRSLADAKIESISLEYQDTIGNQDSYGNMTQQAADVTLLGGQKLSVYDVWFSPVHPKSVKGIASPLPKLTSVPSEGQRAKMLRKEWKQALDREDFDISEMPYQYGKMQVIVGEDGAPQERIVTWEHRGAGCRVDVIFTPDWKPKESYSACN